MSHPLVLALFDTAGKAAAAARTLRGLGVAGEHVSIVARSHDEEGELARASGGSPGSEIEDSRAAARVAELSAHFFSAIALVMPGIGPIVADGPLAAALGEAAGHVAGGIARTLEDKGVSREQAERWEQSIEAGHVLVGAHVDSAAAPAVRAVFRESGAAETADANWES